MKLRMSLETKGLILVTVPLLFELALITILGGVVTYQSNTVRAKAEGTKEIFEHINKIQTTLFMLYDLVEGSPKSEAHFYKGDFDKELHEKEKLIGDTFDKLKNLADQHDGKRLYIYRNGTKLTRIDEETAKKWASGDHSAIKSVKSSIDADPMDFSAVIHEPDLENTTEVTDDVTIVNNASKGMANVAMLLDNAKDLYHSAKLRDNDVRRNMLKKLRNQFKPLVPMFELVPLEEEYYRELKASQDQLVNAQYIGFAAIALLLVVVSISIHQIYSHNVVRRIYLMMENYVRLASDQPLLPRMKQEDEIGTLDHDFHSMANELQTVNEKQRAITENVSDVIFTLDVRGKFVTVNPASERIFGYTPDELLGNKLINLCAPAVVQDVLNALKIVSEGGSEPAFEIQLLKKDGRLIDVSCSATWSEKEKSIFCVARDMTERKQAERLRKEIMQMVSHDLKTPLSTVRSFIEMLDAGMFGELSERGQKLLKLADNSTGRMMTLIKDLLDIEKMEAGMLELQQADVDLSDVFEQASGSVATQASQTGVKVIVAPVSLHAFADADRIVQILVNLLTNAIKFSPAGAQVIISAAPKNNMVEVRVSDKGRGIPQVKLATIFDRFSQVKASDATEKGGSGLGLAICKALVELHGGKINVESAENQGSTFAFTLPAAPAPIEERTSISDAALRELAS